MRSACDAETPHCNWCERPMTTIEHEFCDICDECREESDRDWTKLDEIINVAYERVYKTIDDTLYDLLKNKDDDEFYEDYKEAFTDIIHRLQQDINPTD